MTIEHDNPGRARDDRTRPGRPDRRDQDGETAHSSRKHPRNCSCCLPRVAAADSVQRDLQGAT